MRNPTLWVAAGAALLGLFFSETNPAQPAQTVASAPQHSKSFQLVYHSDTRGYYRPCG